MTSERLRIAVEQLKRIKGAVKRLLFVSPPHSGEKASPAHAVAFSARVDVKGKVLLRSQPETKSAREHDAATFHRVALGPFNIRKRYFGAQTMWS